MRASFFTYQLRIAQLNGWIVTVYTDLEDPDALYAGYVERLDTRYVLLGIVTPWGKLDGYILRRLEDVKQVYSNEDEEIRLQELQRLLSQKPKPLLPPERDDVDLLRMMLDTALASKRMISLMTEEDTYTGILLHVDDLRISLEVLDFFGRPALTPLSIRLRDILMAAVDTEEERMFQLLYQEQMRLVRPEEEHP